MKDYSTAELEAPSPQAGPEKNRSTSSKPGGLRYITRSFSQWLIRDWQTHKYIFFGILLLLMTTIITVIYYANYPPPEVTFDTPAYLFVADRLHLHPNLLADTWRLPGYPILIAIVYMFAGQHNLMAVSIVQATLFVLATMEVYVLAILVLKRTWMAFLIGLIVGTNVILISYVKPIMTEGLALWLLITLALSTVYFIRTMRIHAFWLIVLCLVPLFFTRPEWIYLPVPLFAYLLLVALRRGLGRRILFNALLALVCIYSLVAGYIWMNTQVNHYPGLTGIENFNLLGKVLQYNMQDEAPPQDAQTSHQLDILVVQLNRSPYVVLNHMPALSKDDAQPAGNFARTIILHHPFEFLVKSLPLFLPSLTYYYDARMKEPAGSFSVALALQKSFDRILYRANAFFLLCVPLYFLLFFWRKVKSHPLVLEMAAIVLLAFYGLAITLLGGYKFEDYMRFHIVIDPLLILVVWGSLFLGARFLVLRGSTLYTRFASRICPT